jgi:protein-histidine pros-kinase
MGLRLKYNAVLLAAMVLGIAGAVGLSYELVQQSATRDVEREARLMRANAKAVRAYTITHIDPLLIEDSAILFQPEAVTSFAARTVFDTVGAEFPQYAYKEAALDPTNPEDLPTPLERDMIEQFRADPALDQLSAEIEDENGRFLAMAFPITIENPGCLNCHSTPDIAPPAMLDLYGRENGFGWEFGETVGAQIITVPTTLIARRAEETALLVGSALLAAFGLVLLVTNLLLSRVVIRPVRYLTDMAERVSMGDFSVPETTRKSRDEIGSLASSFNRMRRSLERAMAMLDSNE